MKSSRKQKGLRLTAALALLAAVISLTACKQQEVLTNNPPPVTAGTEQQDTTEATVPSSMPAPTDTVAMRVLTKIYAYSRSSTDAPGVAALSVGDEVEVVSSENGWSMIWLDGHEGYVPTEVLREQGKYLVLIDAGHQRKANTDKEAIGPGAKDMDSKVSAGHQGVSTGMQEYELNLKVALKLKDILESRGYQVMMIRSHNEVDISDAERAEVANRLYADAFIRIHANSDADASVNGVMTLCQTEDNPYNSGLHKLSLELSKLVLDETVASTGANKQKVQQTDKVSGINWCQVPVTTVELGYMSNPEEDQRMATDAYQQKLADGIANGIEKFLE